MADSARPDRPHTTHDLALIAAAAADDLADAAVREAAELIAGCEECAALHADLVAIAAATRALPDPIRPRSFTLSAEQADRLRPTGWRRLRGLRLDQRRFTRPMAVACTTLGLAGLLLAALPSAPLGLLTFGGSAAAPVGTDAANGRDQETSQGIEGSSGDPSDMGGFEASPLVPVGAVRGPSAAPEPAASGDVAAPSGDTAMGATSDDPGDGATDGSIAPLTEKVQADGPSVLVLASLALLVLGLTMLGLVVLAGRRHPGPDDRA